MSTQMLAPTSPEIDFTQAAFGRFFSAPYLCGPAPDLYQLSEGVWRDHGDLMPSRRSTLLQIGATSAMRLFDPRSGIPEGSCQVTLGYTVDPQESEFGWRVTVAPLAPRDPETAQQRMLPKDSSPTAVYEALLARRQSQMEAEGKHLSYELPLHVAERSQNIGKAGIRAEAQVIATNKGTEISVNKQAPDGRLLSHEAASEGDVFLVSMLIAGIVTSEPLRARVADLRRKIEQFEVDDARFEAEEAPKLFADKLKKAIETRQSLRAKLVL